MQQHRPIMNRQNYETSIREFAKLFYPHIRGGTDIDFLYERKGKLLMLEGKHVENGSIKITYGQWKALETLAKNCQNLTMYLIGETPTGFYVCPIQYVKLGMYNEFDQSYHLEVIEWKFYLRSAFVKFIAGICNSFG